MSRPEARGLSTGALTLWALHQGSNTRPMHDTSDRPRSFASAIRVVAQGQKGQSGDKHAEETPIYRRFSAAVQAPTFEGLLVHLRSLVSQLEAAEIPCDYAGLAADLFTWQDPRRRTSVMRNWVASLLAPLKLSAPTLPLTSDVEATQSNKLHF